jgi:hypothetical protein
MVTCLRPHMRRVFDGKRPFNQGRQYNAISRDVSPEATGVHCDRCQSLANSPMETIATLIVMASR